MVPYTAGPVTISTAGKLSTEKLQKQRKQYNNRIITTGGWDGGLPPWTCPFEPLTHTHTYMSIHAGIQAAKHA